MVYLNYSTQLVVLLLLFKGIQCFFIKNVENGKCVLANKKTATTPNPRYGSFHVLKLQDDCFAKRAQFHFLSTNALRNDEAAGCLRGYIKRYVGYYRIIFLYKHVDGNKDFVCGPKSIITQSKEGALMLEFPEKDPRINCAMPSVKYQSGNNAGTLMEFLLTCDNKRQNFKFGSITCEGEKTSKANCAGTQVMIIIHAFYGLSSNMKQCGYTGDTTKTFDVTCKMSSLCDGKSSCEVTVGNWLSNRDPYPGKPKYLYFEYQCLNKTAPATPKPGSNVCSNQLLVNNKKIPDSSFTSSSHTSGHEAYKARFSSQSSWCASDCTTTPYLQIDFGKDLYIIRHVTTRGDAALGKWVGSYNLEYTSDGNNWKKATYGDSYIFPGNDVRNDQVDTMIAVDKGVFARKLKFLPVLYYKQACMSVEICADLFVKPGPPTNLVTDISPRMVVLSWNAPQIQGNGGNMKYIIEIRNDSVKQTYEVDSQSTTKKLDLIPNTKYQISIATKNYVLSSKIHTNFTTPLESMEGFFIKQISSNLCLIIRSKYVDHSASWGALYLTEWKSKCFMEKAQYRFLNTGAIRNDATKGCLKAMKKRYIRYITMFLYEHYTASAKTESCGSGSAVIQTKEGALSFKHGTKKLCATPFTKSDGDQKYRGDLLRFTYKCNGANQLFIFGTLVCEGRSTKNVGCPSSQVMIIKQAYYGVSNTIDSCGYLGSSNCQIDVLCQLKELCDGQQYCKVSANSTFFKHGECSMAKKHLYFEYQCLDKTVSKENKPVDVGCSNHRLQDVVTIPNSWFKSSSNIDGYEAYNARFTSNISWCALSCDKQPFLEVHLGQEMVIKEVATLGNDMLDTWVATYTLNYTQSFTSSWQTALSKGNKIISANDIRVNPGIAKAKLDGDVFARALRFIPVFYYKKICMRIEVCANAIIPTAPKNFKTIQVTSRNVSLSWQPPDEKGDGNLFKYNITIMTDQATIQSLIEEEGKNTSIITSLTPATEYTLIIRGQNKRGASKPVNIQITTEEEAPSGPPNNVTVLTLSSTSLHVAWQNPVQHQQNGAIIKYDICVKETSDSEQCIEPDVTEKKPKTIFDLKPATMYSVSVRAATKIGVGPYSTPVVAKTNIAAVSPAQNGTNTTLTFKLYKPKKTFWYCIIVAIKLKDKKGDTTPTSSYKDNQLKTYDDSDGNYNIPYIVANVTEIVQETFVLGAGNKNEDVKERIRRSTTSQSYYNGPLDPENYYSVFQRFYDQDGSISTDWSEPSKTMKNAVDKPEPTPSPHNKGDNSMVGIIAGVCVVLILVTIAVLGAILFMKRRKRLASKGDDKRMTMSGVAVSAESEDERDLGVNGPQNGHNEGEVNKQPENIYGNQEEILIQKKHDDIAVNELEWHIEEMMKDELFKKEFEELPVGQRYAWKISKRSFNRDKNRYGNIATYDHSRVTLCGDEDSDYINASYIDGITENYYIATQGPKPGTINDFWRLVFEYRCPTIVMLTSLKELGKVKCEKYWPDEKDFYDKIKVTNIETTTFADYVTRVFVLEKDGESHTVKQFHFISWPDHGVPRFPTQFLTFHNHFRKYHEQQTGHVVVHCSAGVGRTGVFIAIHNIIDELDKKKVEYINIFDTLKTMRTRRVNMVQVLEQYIFIHNTLLDYIKCGTNEIDATDLVVEMKNLARKNQQGMTGYEQKFKRLNDLSPLLDEEECEAALLSENQDKNRSPLIYPSETSRVCLSIIDGVANTDYINACFVDGYLGKKFFIATQTPLENTINDFWKMVWETKSSTVVLLNQLREDSQEYPMFWPAGKGEASSFGRITVTLEAAQKNGNVITRKFLIAQSSTSEARGGHKVRMLQYIAWPDHDIPTDGEDFSALFSKVEQSQRSGGAGKSPVIIMCSNGAGRTGTYIATSNLIDRMKAIQTIDVFQAIKCIRSTRPQFVENVAQFTFCYTVLDKLLKSFSEYSNFQEEQRDH